MNFHPLKQTILAILISSLAACDSMISDVAVPESKPKLVINGYISPEKDTLKVIVQLSKPLYTPNIGYDYEYPTVTDAVVTISNGSNNIPLIYNAIEKKYLAITDVFTIEPGLTYYLEARTPRGELATASCTVPMLNQAEIEITKIDSFNDYGYTEKAVSFRFKDLVGEGNFYHVQAGMEFKMGYEGDYMAEVFFENGENYVSDVNKDGEYFLYKTSRMNTQDVNQTNLFIFFALTDENYFNYHRSATNFQGDNPFSEPTPVFTNIKGGLGVFGAYSGQIIPLILK